MLKLEDLTNAGRFKGPFVYGCMFCIDCVT
jgi:hypothetical protein